MKPLTSAALALSLLSSAVCAQSQPAPDLAKGIEREFTHKLLTLRGLYRSNKLRFDVAGKPFGNPELAFGPADAKFELEHADVKNGRLVLAGNLPMILLDESTGSIKFSHGQIKRTVELDLASETWDGAMQSFWKVFFKLDEAVAPSCPAEESEAFRRSILRNNPHAPVTSPEPICLPTGERVLAVDGHGVTAPRSIRAPSPNYPEQARGDRVQGINVLSVIVDPEGRASAIMVLKPLGHGLDEESVKSVHDWKFKPAISNGRPVAVLVNIETRFRLYE